MKNNLFIGALATCILGHSFLYAQIKILLSAAITDAHFEFRKQQYTKSFELLKKYGYHDFYIVEALKKNGPTFLDDYCNNVFYSTADNPNFKNKGINEAKTLLQATYHFNFDPEDIIIKMSGRYHLVSDQFIKTVEAHQDYDAFVRIAPNGNAFTCLFAMRCKYFQEMYENIDCERLEKDWICVETAVAEYIKNKKQEDNFKILHVNKLHLTIDMYSSSVSPGSFPPSYIVGH